MPTPKSCAQKRFTTTRAVSGCCGCVSHLREAEPIARRARRPRHQQAFRHTGLHGRAVRVVVSARENERRARLRQLFHHHRRRQAAPQREVLLPQRRRRASTSPDVVGIRRATPRAASARSCSPAIPAPTLAAANGSACAVKSVRTSALRERTRKTPRFVEQAVPARAVGRVVRADRESRLSPCRKNWTSPS